MEGCIGRHDGGCQGQLRHEVGGATSLEQVGIVEASPLERASPPERSILVAIPLIRLSGRTVRANLTLDEGVVAFMDSEARRRHMTRKAFVEWMARRIAQQGG